VVLAEGWLVGWSLTFLFSTEMRCLQKILRTSFIRQVTEAEKDLRFAIMMGLDIPLTDLNA